MLSVKDISLRFSYKTVLDNVSLNFEKGKIYSIVGENGAGKSTLAKIICGDIKPQSGKIILNDKEVSFVNPQQAIEEGICCVHQRPFIAESISIKENLILGNKNVDYEWMEKLAKEYMPNRKLSTLARELNAYERVSVALINALLKKPSVIILDEPSALLSLAERMFIINKVQSYKSKKRVIIVISHYVNVALEKSDKIVFLKAGKVLLTDETKNISPADAAKYLFDNQENKAFDLSWPKDLNVEFVENKIDERHFSRITPDGKKVGLVPADRTYIGSNPNLTILQILTVLRSGLSQKELVEYAEELCKRANVNIKVNEKASNLSGGMLQRLILQREISEDPDILYLCAPRQGLDLIGVEYLFEVIRTLTAKGVKVYVQEAAS